ncbi:hypothetical protein MtrunA17_Chr1g0176641 [Medicago truncatula]|uniref:Transmembrane protein, putative n=1 Tax=Medicago truncatula TaxID=3880 RepID=A0A072VII2_MEDTR|nr:transmembrane protein, putative [Medicago truncatula]RHN79373.1 hypothetical protein MtrunA17_Chr1g0176641 [Medicago truncatula]
MKILREYVCKGNDVANMRPRVYIDEEEIEVAISYLKNRFTATEEPFTEVVSKTTKKNLKKGFMFITPVLTGLTHELSEFVSFLALFLFLLVSLFFIFSFLLFVGCGVLPPAFCLAF